MHIKTNVNVAAQSSSSPPRHTRPPRTMGGHRRPCMRRCPRPQHHNTSRHRHRTPHISAPADTPRRGPSLPQGNRRRSELEMGQTKDHLIRTPATQFPPEKASSRPRQQRTVFRHISLDMERCGPLAGTTTDLRNRSGIPQLPLRAY